MIITYRKYGMNILYVTLGILFIFVILFFGNFDENFNVENLTKIHMEFYADIPEPPPKNRPAPIDLPYTQPPRPTLSTATPSVPPPNIPADINHVVPVNTPTISTGFSMIPVDCIYYWDSNWSNCVDSSSIRIRAPFTIPPQYGGTACTPGVQIDSSTCPVNCQYNWDVWPTCVPGIMTRTRTALSTIPPVNDGATCRPNAVDTDFLTCNVPTPTPYAQYNDRIFLPDGTVYFIPNNEI